MSPNVNARGVVRPETVLSWIAAIVAVARIASAAPVAPPPLSAETSTPNVDSPHGSGSFGAWRVDAAGLPAFRYALDQTVDPRAQQPELGGGTEAQHQVGNDHIVAAAFNHGYTQLWSQDRTYQWVNFFDAAKGH